MRETYSVKNLLILGFIAVVYSALISAAVVLAVALLQVLVSAEDPGKWSGLAGVAVPGVVILVFYNVFRGNMFLTGRWPAVRPAAAPPADRRPARWFAALGLIFFSLFCLVLFRGLSVYGKNQGSPWRFDENRDGVFTPEEVKYMDYMSPGAFAFCDEDGDNRVTPAEFDNLWDGIGNYNARNLGKTKRTARALYLLEHPSVKVMTLMDVFGRDGRIRRDSNTFSDFFWTDPKFAAFGLDANSDGIITESELRGRFGLPQPSRSTRLGNKLRAFFRYFYF
jgi:hypothetical protein